MNNRAAEEAFKLVGVKFREVTEAIGTIDTLNTSNKQSLILAINEVNTKINNTIVSYTSFLNYITQAVQAVDSDKNELALLTSDINHIKQECTAFKESAFSSKLTATEQADIAIANALTAVTKAAEALASQIISTEKADIATTKAAEVVNLKGLIDVIYANITNPCVIINITNKGDGDNIVHNLNSNFIIHSFQDFDDGNRTKNIFYNTSVTTSQFTLKNDFSNSKFNGRLLCVKY